MKVQLMYFQGCPNAAGARHALCEALSAEQLPVKFDEIESDGPWPSPTILVDGEDVVGDRDPPAAANARACRLRAPTVDEIRAHLRMARRRHPKV